jgi:hypothetical protein
MTTPRPPCIHYQATTLLAAKSSGTARRRPGAGCVAGAERVEARQQAAARLAAVPLTQRLRCPAEHAQPPPPAPQVCGGFAAVEKACNANAKCQGFDMRTEGEFANCAYLKTGSSPLNYGPGFTHYKRVVKAPPPGWVQRGGALGSPERATAARAAARAVLSPPALHHQRMAAHVTRPRPCLTLIPLCPLARLPHRPAAHRKPARPAKPEVPAPAVQAAAAGARRAGAALPPATVAHIAVLQDKVGTLELKVLELYPDAAKPADDAFGLALTVLTDVARGGLNRTTLERMGRASMEAAAVHAQSQGGSAETPQQAAAVFRELVGLVRAEADSLGKVPCLQTASACFRTAAGRRWALSYLPKLQARVDCVYACGACDGPAIQGGHDCLAECLADPLAWTAASC